MNGNKRLKEFEKNLETFRFVVLHHVLPTDSGRDSHWDLLVEHPVLAPKQLLCFEFPAPPEMWFISYLVSQLPDHREIYLTYEGPISSNRGVVSRVLSGTIFWLPNPENMLIARIESLSLPPNWLNLIEPSKPSILLNWTPIHQESADSHNRLWQFATSNWPFSISDIPSY